ncbi:hypothetical protein GGR16_001471 [Chelatococcus caeni]|uniref:Uncharacterized protein n=1 Tax=Chelatococcus caeni TaxID=1348468 RepID=A0A840BSU4_9HYPH|nr:hypothetical protein [Chelatococcus caeni]MBB4016465.1 hypothetical protein [Chelatococcus caeni]
MRSEPTASFWGTLLYILAGPLLWAVQFTLIYAGHTAACLPAVPETLAVPLVAVPTVAAALAAVAFILRQEAFARALGAPEPPRAAALHAIARIAVLLALVAVIWSGFALALVDSCLAGR